MTYTTARLASNQNGVSQFDAVFASDDLLMFVLRDYLEATCSEEDFAAFMNTFEADPDFLHACLQTIDESAKFVAMVQVFDDEQLEGLVLPDVAGIARLKLPFRDMWIYHLQASLHSYPPLLNEVEAERFTKRMTLVVEQLAASL
jgi:hypothetical protein